MINASRYQIPVGWQTREQVAVELQCDPDRVADLLKPGLQSGDFERKDFPVWDSARRLAARVVCFRISGGKPLEKTTCNTLATGNAVAKDETCRVKKAMLSDPTKDDRSLAKNYRMSVAEVRKIRASLSV